MKTVGVLALQGAVEEHLRHIELIGYRAKIVLSPEDISSLDALIIPGGESTAISHLIASNSLTEAIKEFASKKPVFGTCAGLITCAKSIEGTNSLVTPLQLIDCHVSRNGFGRQKDSFEVMLDIPAIGSNIPSVFIRAPYIIRAGKGVRILASIGDKIVMAESGTVLVCAFHPELTEDLRILEYFISKIR